MNLFTFRKRLIALSLFLTLGVILLGAYTRLVDAGLGCPDWPGCYGLWRVPATHSDQIAAQAAFPLAPMDYMKAQTEMVHRYFASTLGLLIVIITGITLFSKNPLMSKSQKILTLCLTGLVIFQGLLGMWTVTLKLLPIVVMAHLLGGLLLLSLLFCLWIMQSPTSFSRVLVSKNTRRLAVVALIALACQIALGGWTSTNYAALSCPDFPLCQNQWWPNMSWQAFDILGALKVDNPLTYMSLEARTTIHMAHRIGALITTCLIVCLMMALWKHKKQALWLMVLIFSLLLIQIGLGITNVLALLPLKVALAHNGVATLLLLSMIYLQFYLQSGSTSS